MMKKVFFLLLILFIITNIYSQNLITLDIFSTGYTRISCIASAGDSRLFVVNQNGYIDICDTFGVKQNPSFLNIDAKTKSTGNEQGLLGLAFHPNYANNGYFYVNYINNSGNTVVARYSVDPNNANLADVNSELILLTIPQPFSNHNGGDMHFGPDGYLYIGMGDGGSAGDPGNRAQNPQELLGKMLRIEVNNSTPGDLYDIPANNPFAQSTSTLPEIWAIGLRNPWRYSFDRLTGDMWIADVGQNVYEEINFQPAASTGGENYGWRCYEANSAYNTAGCQPQNTYVPPISNYSHTGGSCSVTGGYVYRGSQYPSLYGKYIYCDYCSGKFWAIEPNATGGWSNLNAGTFTTYNFSCFGQNHVGELFVGGNSDGVVYKIKGLCGVISLNATVEDALCNGQNTGSIYLNATGGTPPYSYLWYNGTTADSLIGLGASNQYHVTVTDANQCVQTDTIIVGAANTISITSLVTAVNCSGGTNGAISVSASGGTGSLNYSWSNGQTGSSITGLSAASYSVIITDSIGCVAEENFLLPEPSPIVTVTDSIGIGMLGVTATGGVPPYTYLWSNSGTTSAINCIDTGMFYVWVTDANGCTEQDSGFCPLAVGIASKNHDIVTWTIKPNPAKGFAETEVFFNTPISASIGLYDIKGRKLLEENHAPSLVLKTKLNLEHIVAGIYWIQIATPNGKAWQKLILQ